MHVLSQENHRKYPCQAPVTCLPLSHTPPCKCRALPGGLCPLAVGGTVPAPRTLSLQREAAEELGVWCCMGLYAGWALSPCLGPGAGGLSVLSQAVCEDTTLE